MGEEKLNKESLKKVWLKFWTLVKVIVGDVDVEGKGDLQTQIDALVKIVEKQSGNVEEYNNNTSYQIGMYCLYKGIMYKCVQNTAGEWNPDSWKQTTTLQEINKMQQQLDKVMGNNSDGDTPKFAEGIKSNNVIDALNEVFTLGSDNKQKFVDNLTAMGIHASTNDSWETLINKILDMTDTSKDTVTAAVLLAGYTAHDATGDLVNGGMTNNSGTTVDADVTQDDTYTYMDIPAAGYYDKNSKLRSANSNLQRVFEVGNGTNMKTFLPNDYKKLTIDNFFVTPPVDFGSSHGIHINNCTGNSTVSANFYRGTFAYDAETGIFTLGNPSVRGSDSLITGGSETATGQYGKAICVYPF